jgi:transcriptional regulator with XRE-family HTH domain
MPQTLGERIRELREAKDISLREFAAKLDVSPAFVSDIELGRRYPSDAVLAKMAKILGTTLEDLKALDTRPPVSKLRRLATSNPTWGLAFRKVLEMPPEDLIKYAEQRKRRKAE